MEHCESMKNCTNFDYAVFETFTKCAFNKYTVKEAASLGILMSAPSPDMDLYECVRGKI